MHEPAQPLASTCECGEPAFMRCGGCKKAFCMAHARPGKKVCAPCDVKFFEHRDASRTYRLAKLLGFALPWLLYLVVLLPVVRTFGWFAHGGSMRSFSTGIPALDLAIITGFVSFACAGAAATITSRRLRRTYFDRPLRASSTS